MKKRISVFLAAVLLISVMCGCGSAKSAPEEAVNVVKEMISELALSEDENNYSLDSPSEDEIVFSIYFPGMHEEMTLASLGDERDLKNWNYDIGDMMDMSEEYTQAVADAGYDGVSVSVALYSEIERDLLMAYVKNGVLYYDIVSGFDIRK